MKEPTAIQNILRSARGVLGPDWRWTTAETLPTSLPLGFTRQCDPLVRETYAYLMMKSPGDAGTAGAESAHPLIAAAEKLNADPDLTAKLKIMAAAGMDVAEMHQRVGIEIAIIQTWEALYFDMRDLRDATSWLECQVLDKERQRGNTALAARLKLAICAGPAAARLMLDLECETPVDEADRLFQNKLRLALKVDEALEAPLETARERLRLISLHNEIHLGTKRLELEGRKLEQKCVEVRNRHELQELRLGLAMKRAEQQIADKQRRNENRQLGRAELGQDSREIYELRQHRVRAERMAAAARIAISPLAQLQWSAAPDPTPMADEQIPLNSAGPVRAAGSSPDNCEPSGFESASPEAPQLGFGEELADDSTDVNAQLALSA